MKRYNSVYDGVYTKPNEMVEEANGDWVRWEDVQEKCAELESKCAELLEASVYNTQLGFRWEARTFIDQLRAAIAKAKGGSNE